jgi:hypothetical protein
MYHKNCPGVYKGAEGPFYYTFIHNVLKQYN